LKNGPKFDALGRGVKEREEDCELRTVNNFVLSHDLSHRFGTESPWGSAGEIQTHRFQISSIVTCTEILIRITALMY
jgi:hypothetical protein